MTLDNILTEIEATIASDVGKHEILVCSVSRLSRIIAALRKRTKMLEDFAEGDCGYGYGGGCPKTPIRHGRCGPCRAREALEEA